VKKRLSAIIGKQGMPNDEGLGMDKIIEEQLCPVLVNFSTFQLSTF
jgi:hypothetical protein